MKWKKTAIPCPTYKNHHQDCQNKILSDNSNGHYLVFKKGEMIGCTGEKSTKKDVLKIHPGATFTKVESICSVCKKTYQQKQLTYKRIKINKKRRRNYMNNNEKAFANGSKITCEIINKVFRHNIPADLFEKRDNFCPTKGSITCDKQCPIYAKYYSLGFSCNGALDKYPNDCISLMDNAMPEDETDKSVLITNIFSVMDSAFALAGYKIMNGDRETLIVRHSATDSDFEIKITELA